MAAYAVFAETVTDATLFDQYRGRVMPTLSEFDGTFIVRGGAFTVMEGEWKEPRLVIIAFPTRAAAEGWYHSPAYQAVLPMRLKASKGNCIIVDGV